MRLIIGSISKWMKTSTEIRLTAGRSSKDSVKERRVDNSVVEIDCVKGSVKWSNSQPDDHRVLCRAYRKFAEG